jgi:hypothetical protein
MAAEGATTAGMSDEHRQSVIVPADAELPPPRPGVRYVRVPVIGVIIADDELRDRIDRRFHWPMIFLALAILPLLAIGYFQRPEGWLRAAIEIGFFIIWAAFVIEFVVKITIAEARLQYVRKNWLDLVIILLPALRALRIARAGSSLAKTTRVFRLRGVGMKCARYVFTVIIGLEATDRLLERIGIKRHVDRKDPAKMTRYELIDEIKRLRKLADAWETWYEAQEAYASARDGEDAAHAPKPMIDESVDGSDEEIHREEAVAAGPLARPETRPVTNG